MAIFDYTGQIQSGQSFAGTLDADSIDQARQLLTSMGIRVASLRKAERTAYVAPLSLDDMLFFNEQIAAMAHSGVPMEEGLRHLASEVGSRKLKRLLLDLADDLSSGLPLDQAVEKQKRRFPDRYPEVVRAGLKTGNLGGTLYGLSAHLRLKGHFRRILLEITVYPLLVLVLGCGVIAFFMRYVMPQVIEILYDWEMALPRVVVWGVYITHAWPTIELVVGAVVAALILVGIVLWLPGMKAVRERVIRKLPGAGRVYWSSVLARFAHTSALAAYTGTPLAELIQTAGASTGSPAMEATTRRVVERIESGQSLEAATRNERDLPALWTCVVASTATRGELPAALQELALNYENRAQQWVSTVRLLLGPFLLLMLAILFGGLVTVVFAMLATLIRGITSVAGF